MRPFKQFMKDENGGPAIEFAVVGLFIALCFPPLLDITTLIHGNTQSSAGLRAGMQFALKYPADEAGIAEAVRQGGNMPTATVTSRQFCECNGAESSCTSACIGGERKRYSEVSASYNLSYRYNLEDIYPSTLSKTITARIQ